TSSNDRPGQGPLRYPFLPAVWAQGVQRAGNRPPPICGGGQSPGNRPGVRKFPTAVPGQPEEGPELCPEPQCGGRKPADQPGPGGGGPTVPQGNETGGAPGRGHRPPRPGPCAPAPVCEPGIPYGGP